MRFFQNFPDLRGHPRRNPRSGLIVMGGGGGGTLYCVLERHDILILSITFCIVHVCTSANIIFQNFSKNVINDLYKLCFQNYCASLIKVVMKRNNLNCINHFLV